MGGELSTGTWARASELLGFICPLALGEQGWGVSGTWRKVDNQSRVGDFPSPSRIPRRAGCRGVCGLPGRGVPCAVPGDTSSRLSRGLRADSAPPGLQGAAPAPPCALGPAPRPRGSAGGGRGYGVRGFALPRPPWAQGSRPPARVFRDAIPGGEFPPPPAAAPPSAGRPARQVKLGPSLPPVRDLSPEPLRRPQPGPWAPAAQAAWWRWATGSPGRGDWAGGPGGRLGSRVGVAGGFAPQPR